MNFDKSWDEICKMKEEFIGQKEQIAKLTEENRALKEQMAKMKKLIPRRPLPSELVNEMFACLPLENAFGLLTGMPNGLLARNVRKMLKSIKKAMKANKWNTADCGPNLTIFDGGLKVEHSGPNGRKRNSVRAVLPIPKFTSNIPATAYFEVKILKNLYYNGMSIGFCTQQVPLEWNRLEIENGKNLIGITGKGIMINASLRKFRNAAADECFNFGDVIGFGLIHSPANSPIMKCFASRNGELLGMAELPAKFADLQLFPAAYLFHNGDSMRANFGQDEWRFDPSQLRK